MNISKLMGGGGTLARRRRFMSRKDDCTYQRIEYLESSEGSGGKAYINSGYVPSGRDIEVSTTFELLGFKDNSAWCDIWSAYVAENVNTYRCIRNVNTNMLLFYNGATAGDFNSISGVLNSFPVEFNKKYNVYISGIDYFRCNEKTGVLDVAIRPIENDKTLTLFTLRIGQAYCRFYFFKLKKAGVPVLDLIPVRIENEGFMYDRVSGKLFGNAGTGRFILGPDINS